MFTGDLPIASGYRGSRQIATLEDFYGPAERKSRNRNNEKESAKKNGRTAHAASNLRSYLNQRIPKHALQKSMDLLHLRLFMVIARDVVQTGVNY